MNESVEESHDSYISINSSSAVHYGDKDDYLKRYYAIRTLRQENNHTRGTILSSLKSHMAAASAKLFVVTQIAYRSLHNTQNLLVELEHGKLNAANLADAARSLTCVSRESLPTWS